MSRVVLSVGALLVMFGVMVLLAPVVSASPSQPTHSTPVITAQGDDGDTEGTADDEGTTDGTGDSEILPEGISRVFAVLGLYVATMFTMAIGTEIVVDILKIALRLKGKPDAMDTLAEYEAMLPGKLEDLGVSAEARLRLEKQYTALKGILTPAIQAQETIFQLQQGNFTEAVEAAIGEGKGQEIVDKVKDVLKEQLDTAVNQVNVRSPLGKSIVDRVQSELEGIIDDLAQRATQLTPDDLYEQSQTLLNGKLAETTTDWVEEQLLQLQTQSYETAQSTYESYIKPQFTNLGLSDNIRAGIEAQFDQFLKNLKIAKGTDEYLQALNGLLVEVERQRDALRSRVGSLWLALTDWIDERLHKMGLKHYHPRHNLIIERPDEAINKFIAIQQRDKQENRSRIQLLRLASVIVSLGLAYFLQVDSAVLLGDLFPENVTFLNVTLIQHDAGLFTWFGNLFNIDMYDLTAGVILTGLAASAGSGFWHDQLTRLQSVKQGAEQAYTALQPVINIQQPGKEGEPENK